MRSECNQQYTQQPQAKSEAQQLNDNGCWPRFERVVVGTDEATGGTKNTDLYQVLRGTVGHTKITFIAYTLLIPHSTLTFEPHAYGSVLSHKCVVVSRRYPSSTHD